MRLNSNEAEKEGFELSDFIAQHTPEVMCASLMLQNIMGIEPGTSPLDDDLVAKLWEFPSRQCLQIEADEGSWISQIKRKRPRLEIPTIVVNSPDRARAWYLFNGTLLDPVFSAVPHMAGSNLSLVCENSPLAQATYTGQEPWQVLQDEKNSPPGTIILTQPQKRGAPESLLQHVATAPRQLYADPSKSHFAAARESASRSQGFGPALERGHLAPTLGQATQSCQKAWPMEQQILPIDHHARGASPPLPSMQSDTSFNFELYWDPFLSNNIRDWLKDTHTRAWRSNITSLKLHSEECPSLCFYAQDLSKLNLRRITLPLYKQTLQSPCDTQQDWFVIEVWHRPDDASSVYFLSRSSWLMAFPFSAVTASSIVADRIVWTLGHAHRGPAVHGRGNSVSLLGDFLRACAQGKGILEMSGMGPMC